MHALPFDHFQSIWDWMHPKIRTHLSDISVISVAQQVFYLVEPAKSKLDGHMHTSALARVNCTIGVIWEYLESSHIKQVTGSPHKHEVPNPTHRPVYFHAQATQLTITVPLHTKRLESLISKKQDTDWLFEKVQNICFAWNCDIKFLSRKESRYDNCLVKHTRVARKLIRFCHLCVHHCGII